MRIHRVEAGLTQEELAERSGLSVRAIRNLEIGRTARPRRTSVLLLAKALGLAEAAANALCGLAQRARPLVGMALPRPRPSELAPQAPPPQPRARWESWQAGWRQGEYQRLIEEPPAYRCELPADVPALPGRELLTDELCGYLTDPAGRARYAPGAVALVAVTGVPGSGRTALAVHVAHRLREDFPHGQIYVDAQCGPDRSMPLPDILGRVLRSLGVTDLPADTEERAALVRAMLNEFRLLLVIDNVACEAQVRPLLATSARSAILVTSRGRLDALHGGHRVTLTELGAEDAVRVLAGVAGRDRVAAQVAAARDIVALCGRLPLAVHIAGAWLAARPYRTLREFAALLADERQRLGYLRVGDLTMAGSIAAYHRRLTPALRRALHRLAGHGPAEIDTGTVAGLLDVPPAQAQEVIEGLAHGLLLTPAGPGGYLLPPLVRLYATALPEICQITRIPA